MIISLVLLQAQTKVTQQPVEIDVTSYQAVQHALPNGAPDANAPDNYYVKIDSHFVLTLDSNRFPVEVDGTRHVHEPAFSYLGKTLYEENRPAKGAVADLFREVHPRENPVLRSQWTSKMVSGPVDNVIGKGQRLRSFRVFTTIQKVEIHSDKKGQIIRKDSETSVGTMTEGGYENSIYDPSHERVYWCESKPDVRIDPPKYVFEGK